MRSLYIIYVMAFSVQLTLTPRPILYLDVLFGCFCAKLILCVQLYSAVLLVVQYAWV